MGVQGLWKLVEPCGRTVPLESMSNKVLAVDVSIWLHQAMHGMHDVQGAPVAVAHLLVLFHRLCKLLFYKIKPVFVFDGGVPALKRQTIANRRLKKSTARSEASRVRGRLLKNLLKHEALRHVLADQAATAVLGLSSLTLPGPAEEEDLYKLPPVASQPSTSSSSSSSESEDEAPLMDIHSVDVESEAFRALPAEVRHDILSDLKETRKQSSWRTLDQMPQHSQDFSDFQMNRLLKRRAVQKSLDECGKEMGARDVSLQELQGLLGSGFSAGSVLTGRVAQEDATKFMLIQKPQLPAQTTSSESDMNKKGLTNASEGFDITQNLGDVMWSSDSEEEKLVKGESFKSLKSSPEKLRDDGRLKPNQFPLSELLNATVNDIAAVLEEGIDCKKSELQEPMKICQEIDALEKQSNQREVAESIKIEPADNSKDEFEEKIYIEKSPVVTLQCLANGAPKQVITQILNVLESSESENEEKVDVTMKKNNGFINEQPEGSSGECDMKMEVMEESIAPENNVTDQISTKVVKENYNDTNLEKVHGNLLLSLEPQALDSTSSVKNKTVEPEILKVGSSDVKVLEDNSGVINNDQEMIDYLEDKTKQPPMNNSDKKELGGNNPLYEEQTNSENLSSLKDKEDEKSSTDDEFIPVEDTPPKYPTPLQESEGSDDEENSTMKDDDIPAVLTEEEVKRFQESLQTERDQLLSEKGRQERMAQSVTDQMCADAQELLRLFGVPYVVAPMEAEAQCAALDLLGLTEGTITDDSDIWLFGGRVVYKNFFNQKKHVLEYRCEDIHHYFKLSREDMVRLALLVGSDYTPGLPGIGPVTALEVLATFPSPTAEHMLTGLRKFQQWVASGFVVGPSRASLKNKLKNTSLTPEFPSEAVVHAYLYPEVDQSEEHFSWARPNLQLLEKYAKIKFGWTSERCNELLLPVMKKLLETTDQPTIDRYFRVVPSSTLMEGRMSKRVEGAVKRLGRPLEPDDSESDGAKPGTSRPKKAKSSIDPITARLHQDTIIPQRERDRLRREELKKKAAEILKTGRGRSRGRGHLRLKAAPVVPAVNLSESSDSN